MLFITFKSIITFLLITVITLKNPFYPPFFLYINTSLFNGKNFKKVFYIFKLFLIFNAFWTDFYALIFLTFIIAFYTA